MVDWHRLLEPMLRRELIYVGLLFALFVLPRIVQRLRVPPAITAFLLGAGVAAGPRWLVGDPTVELLSTLGIVSLFLFAGLEVEVAELRQDRRVLFQHLVIRVLVLGVVGFACRQVLGLAWRPALIVALALLIPSTGFILDSIKLFGFSAVEERWVKLKAVASELLALVALFFITQSGSAFRLGLSLGLVIAMIAFLPVVFRFFARHIVPYAPGSEFAFVMIVAVVCALITRELGVYYLLGAFIVGVASQRFRRQLPAVSSRDLLRATELFASFFIPFYFFHAGSSLSRGDFGPHPLWIGLVMFAVAVPLRVGVLVAHRSIALNEPARRTMRIALALVPTLVFTLVLAEILRDRYLVPREIYGGLVLYAVATTVIPGFVFKLPAPDYTSPHLENGDEDARVPSPAPQNPVLDP